MCNEIKIIFVKECLCHSLFRQYLTSIDYLGKSFSCWPTRLCKSTFSVPSIKSILILSCLIFIFRGPWEIPTCKVKTMLSIKFNFFNIHCIFLGNIWTKNEFWINRKIIERKLYNIYSFSALCYKSQDALFQIYLM